MKKNILLYTLLFISFAATSSLLTCVPDIAGGGSEVETMVGLYGNLVHKDGAPAEGAIVKVFLVVSNPKRENSTLDSIPVDTTITDDDGVYLFDNLEGGIYNIEGVFIDNSDTLYAAHKNIIHDSITDAGTDTLLAPGYIKGQVDFDQDDKMGVSVYIPGTSYFAFTNKDGRFVISGIPPDSFYIVAYEYPNYLRALDSNITVTSGDTTYLDIKQLERDTTAPPPTPEGVTVVYDSIQGIVKITWSPINYAYLAGYLVYRKDSSLTAVYPELISGNTLVTDTVFFDTVFQNFKDSIPIVYQYQVKSQDKKNSLSSISQPAYTKVFPLPPPTNLNAVYDSIQGIVNVTWSKVNRAYLAGYRVYRKDSSTSSDPELISGNNLITDTMFFDTVFHDFNDSLPKVFQYQVKSQDTKTNTSKFSQPVYEKVLPLPPPVGLTAAYDSLQGIVKLTWNPVNRAYINGYRIYRKDSSLTNNPELISGSLIITDTLFYDSIFINLVDTVMKVYQYNVKSQDSKNNQSRFSDPEYIKVYPPDLPGNPIPADGDTGVNFTINLSWSPINGNGNDIVKYTVFFGSDTHPTTIIAQDITDTITVISGLNEKTTYYWFVSASYGNITVHGSVWHFKTNRIGGVKWEFTTGDKIFSSPAIASDGTIYLGSDDHKLYAINPDGSKKWEFTTGDKIFSSPTISTDGTIYLTSLDRKLYAINPDGTIKWEFSMPLSIFATPAIGIDGTIYVGADDEKFYAINPDGTIKWEFQPTGGTYTGSNPVISTDGIIYIYLNQPFNCALCAINPDGSKKWEFGLKGRYVDVNPAISLDGTIYVGTEDSTLYAINPNGTKKWEFKTENSLYRSGPTIGIDGTIYLGCRDSKLYAINPDGTKKWEFNTEAFYGIYSNALIGSDGTIYIGSMNSKLFAINPNGTKKWENKIGSLGFCSSPVISVNGIIYIGVMNNKIYAIVTKCSGLANSPWPMYMHDAKHTGRSD